MRLGRVTWVLIFVLAVGAMACGGKGQGRKGHSAAAASPPAPPTPDTTPIASLRTPAGWLLVKGEKPAPTPTPSKP
jgi:hypothetical protein